MRNAFAEEKITYIEDTGQVLYRSAITHGKNKKNFELFPAGQFIAMVTQHIPEKGLDGALLRLVFKQGKRAAAQGGNAETRG